jgi:hypothetical protein
MSEVKSATRNIKNGSLYESKSTKSNIKQSLTKENSNTFQKKIDENIKNYNIENSFQMNLL